MAVKSSGKAFGNNLVAQQIMNLGKDFRSLTKANLA